LTEWIASHYRLNQTLNGRPVEKGERHHDLWKYQQVWKCS